MWPGNNTKYLVYSNYMQVQALTARSLILLVVAGCSTLPNETTDAFRVQSTNHKLFIVFVLRGLSRARTEIGNLDLSNTDL